MTKMKIIGLIILTAFLITACSSDTAQVNETDLVAEAASGEVLESPESSDSPPEKTREELRADFADNALPPASQLVVGTLMLEDTEYAVESELASYLTPYWKLYKNLLESDNTAQEELNGLIADIQEVMTPDQVNYIAGLELTQEDLMTLAADLGIFEQLGAEGYWRWNWTWISKTRWHA